MVEAVPADYPGVMPYLVVNDGAGAIDFYTRAFGAEERGRMPMPGGKLAHAEIVVNGHVVMLADEMPGMGSGSPTSLGGTPVSLMFYVPDVDAAFKRALDAGATQVEPVEDKFYGDRSGTLRDPYGHLWHLATHVRDVSEEEMAAAMSSQ